MKSISQSHLNMDAAAAIVEIVSKHKQLKRFRVFEPESAPLVQERMNLSEYEREFIEAAAGLKRDRELPFWDGVLLSCFNASEPPTRLLHAASYHNQSDESVRFIDCQNVSVEQVREIACQMSDNRMLAVSSLVELLDGSHRHIPMLDFHCSAKPENLRLVETVIRELGIGSGLILESGKSFHFYGEALLTEKELISFLGKALLFAPIVDRAWIAHQLIESACALRISPKTSGGKAPYVVSRIA